MPLFVYHYQNEEFEDKKLVLAAKEGLKLDESEDEAKKKEELKEKFEGLCKVVKDVLGDRVEKVVVSDRLTVLDCQHGKNHEGSGLEG
ncbi:hypothetical protein ACE6H2_020730 [Prunus campanulata]